MPLIYIDILDNRTEDETRALADAAHAAVVEAFEVPERDRYQIVNVHRPEHMIIEDTGLGIERSTSVVVVRVVSKQRTEQMKQNLYELLASHLHDACGLNPDDLVVTVTENDDADWSFGHGRAQFLTGELR
jgi:phenylpyruvate tautomerase PptA (4-oxalocrotonate tautomerase family)